MGYYTKEHTYYCGIDLHASTMYVSVCDATGKTLLHKNMKTEPHLLGRSLEPYREDIVVACECVFAWYWLADWCADENIPFVLGHALGMSAIYKAKVKDDSKDAAQIVRLLRTGFLPMAYAYPREMRQTRDLFRRRLALIEMQTRLINHSQMLSLTHKRQRLPKKINYKQNRRDLKEYMDDPAMKLAFEANCNVLEAIGKETKRIESEVRKRALKDAPQEFHRLKSIPGIGDILGMTILYEIHTIDRFKKVGDFVSYCRLITPEHRSGGKRVGSGNKRIGNKYLRWAFGEAAVLMIRSSKEIKSGHDLLAKSKGTGKALSILSARIARTAYYLLKNKRVFELEKFLNL